MSINLYAQKNKNTLFFIENKGQWEQEVLFLCRLPNIEVWLTKQGVVYDFYELETHSNTQQLRKDKALNYRPQQYKKGEIVRVINQDNTSLQALPSQPLPTVYNYYLGNDTTKWATNVGLYAQVMLKNVFKGIHQKFYFNKGNLRYDYIVEAGANPQQIKFKIKGSKQVYINSNNELVFTTNLGEVKHSELFVYQTINGVKHPINAKFVLLPNQTIGFKIDEYNTKLPLIIDPIIYSTYVGGSTDDQLYDIEVNSNHEAVVVGSSNSPDYPKNGMYSYLYKWNVDAVCSKLSQWGSFFVFSTFLGGYLDDEANALAIDDNDNIYITGYTNSPNFPVYIGPSTTLNGTSDAFIIKMHSTGQVKYSTYIGGSGLDEGLGVAVNSNGEAYFTGETWSNDFPVTANAYSSSYSGQGDAFICKMRQDGLVINYATYIGGSNSDDGKSIAINNLNEIYLTGITFSSDFPSTSNAFDPVYNGDVDGYVLKLNNAGNNIEYSTFIGDTLENYTYSIALDNNKNAYITGFTEAGGGGFPITSSAYNSNINGGNFGVDIFALKLNPNGSNLEYSTYIHPGYATSIKIDPYNNAYISGMADTLFPTTTDAIYSTSSNLGDAFVTKLNASGTDLHYSTLIGGANGSIAFGVDIDDELDVYLTGWTSSIDFPVTQYAPLQNNLGNDDGFITKIGVCSPFNSQAIINTPLLCKGDTLIVTSEPSNMYSYNWQTPTNFLLNKQTDTILNVSPNLSGTFILTVTDSAGCKSTDTTDVNIIQPPIINYVLVDDDQCIEDLGSVEIIAIGDSLSYSIDQINFQTDSIFNQLSCGTYTLTISSNNLCFTSDTVTLNKPAPKPPLIVDVHNAISPNGDGENDTWVIDVNKNVDEISVKVFNRWGAIIYSSSNYNNNWSGTYMNKPIPAGIYFYTVTVKQNDEVQQFTGSLTVLR